MSWTEYYQYPVATLWQGRHDLPENATFFQIINLLDLREQTVIINQETLAFGFIGFCCDVGIKRNQGRLGARLAPDVIRQELSKLAVQKTNFQCYDVGNIVCKENDLEAAQDALAHVVTVLLNNHITPIVLGGGHELAWGHYQGIRNACEMSNVGIVNFDAHFDMRPLLNHQQGTSGTPFLQIANACVHAQKKFDYNCIGIQKASNIELLFATAKQFDTQMLLAEDIYQQPFNKQINFLDRVIQNNHFIYTSLCLDVFASSYAPGVSAPQAFGLTPWQVIPLLRHLATSGKVISYDIAELSPPLDIDQRTAKLAANFIFEITHHHTRQNS